jgi:hypothetical protein
VDSNVKRGRSRFQSVIGIVKQLETFIATEVKHRNLQASIVVVRKVNGTSQNARFLLDNQRTGTSTQGDVTLSREKINPGSILSMGKNIDIEFKQPDTNFSDASPLASLLIMQIAVATGWTYPMISADPGQGALANSLVEQGPVHQMVEAERKFFRCDLEDIFKRVISAAFRDTGYSAEFKKLGLNSSDDLWEGYDLHFRYGQVVSRDPQKDAQAANIGVLNKSMSRAEFCRRVNADPDQMRREVIEESGMKDPNGLPLYPAQLSNQMPDAQAMADSSSSNASKGQGTNQGNTPARHSDNQSVGSSQKA